MIKIDVRPEQEIVVPSDSKIGSLLGLKKKKTLLYAEYPNIDDLCDLVGVGPGETLVQRDLLVLPVIEKDKKNRVICVVRAAFVKEREPVCRVTLGKPVCFGGLAVIYTIKHIEVDGNTSNSMSSTGFPKSVLESAFGMME